MWERRLFLLLVSCFSLFYGCDGGPADDCPVGWFDCGDQRCVDPKLVCDGYFDCKNKRDEQNCSDDKFYLLSEENEHVRTALGVIRDCGENETRCRNGKSCVHQSWICDGISDCEDNSDEDNCAGERSKCEGFQCQNRLCIPKGWECDGTHDCSDGSDEDHCEHKLNCGKLQYDCGNMSCIFLNHVCNGHVDCHNGMDEGGLCDVACDNHTCDSSCQPTPTGPRCLCGSGFVLGVDETSCIDFDECAFPAFDPCSQICNNTNGSFVCSCFPGYLSDGLNNCYAEGPEPLLLFTTPHEVRGMWLRSQRYFPIVKAKGKALGIGFDGISSRMYWAEFSDNESGAIYSSNLDGTDAKMVVSRGLKRPEDISVDWLGRNLYIADGVLKEILACKIDGSMCTILVHEEIDNPKSIVVIPKYGVMFWADWGMMVGIYKAEMNGMNVKALITREIERPYGITFDFISDRVYWCDIQIQVIESINMDGMDRKILFENSVFRPFAMTVFEDIIYYSDWSQISIRTCNKRTGHRQSVFLRGMQDAVVGMHIYHPVLHTHHRQATCLGHTCEHLCLLNVFGTSCACQYGFRLLSDGSSCRPTYELPFVVVSELDTLYHVQTDTIGEAWVTELKADKLSTMNALAFDLESHTLFISDFATSCIYALNYNTYDLQLFIGDQLDTVRGLEFDHLGRNLYWTDVSAGLVEAASFDGKTRVTLLRNITLPMTLALDPEEGEMFITRGKVNTDIIKCNMDGRKCSVPIHSRLAYSLVLDINPLSKRLFWAEMTSRKIESFNKIGEDARLEVNNTGIIYSMVLTSSHIFWVETEKSILNYTSLVNGTGVVNSFILPSESPGQFLIRLTSVRLLNTSVQHPCSTGKGVCSHMCMVSPDGFTCGCNSGMVISSDNRTCEEPKTPVPCLISEFQCKSGKCIFTDFRCDNRLDCPDGSDEEGCHTIECPDTDFRCTSGQCILGSFKCDRSVDCLDSSDEIDCVYPTCDPTEFTCVSEGTCIPRNWVCDGKYDCKDKEDEDGCKKVTCAMREFLCHSGLKCIGENSRCDGEDDCNDGSDEINCNNTRTCMPSEFPCDNGYCLDNQVVCDRHRDCTDGSDEKNCTYGDVCLLEQFRCSNGTCIDDDNMCDKIDDCLDGGDERDCPDVSCGPSEFTCRSGSGICIPHTWVCDGKNDCGENEDELLKKCHTHSNETVTCEGFICDRNKCIPWGKVCNNDPDCLDATDEGIRCGTWCKYNNGGCSHICHGTPKRGLCFCREGFFLLNDKMTCADVNECLIPGKCSQLCVNVKGSFKCSCYAGYQLAPNKRSCKAKGPSAHILIETTDTIRILSMDGHNETLLDHDLPLKGLDVDEKDGTVYWTNAGDGKIKSKAPGGELKIVVRGLNQPLHLQLDWVANNFYFISQTNDIVVCRRDGAFVADVILMNGTSYSLALAPIEGLMFWSVTRDYVNVIERSGMDGSDIRVIVSKKLMLASALTVDLTLNRLYWTDRRVNTVQFSDFAGNGRQTLTNKGLSLPQAIALFEDHLYWSNINTRKIFRCDKFTGENPEPFHWEGLRVMAMKISHPVQQPAGPNFCALAECEQLCLLNPTGYSCVCGYGFESYNTTKCLTKDGGNTTDTNVANTTDTDVANTTDKTISCPLNYCFNNGECFVENGQFICNCTAGFKGPLCKDKIEMAQGGNWVPGVVSFLVLLVLVLLGLAIYYWRKRIIRRREENVGVRFTNEPELQESDDVSTEVTGILEMQGSISDFIPPINEDTALLSTSLVDQPDPEGPSALRTAEADIQPDEDSGVSGSVSPASVTTPTTEISSLL